MQKRLSIRDTARLAVLGLVGIAAPAYGSLITNGSFELASIEPGSFATLPEGSTAIDGWTVRGPDSIDYIGSLWVASDGDRSLDLSGTPGLGGIEQSFVTIPGTEYQVTFDLAGNPEAGPTLKELLVSAAAQSQSFIFDITNSTLSDLGWVEVTWNFVASSSSTVLAFDSLTQSANGPALDNVSVVAVPEPSVFSLVALGSLGVIRRRTKSD